jgi:hypothetical protein
MNFEFALNKSVVTNIELINKILVELNTETLSENKSFHLHKDSAGTNGIHFTIYSTKDNTAQFELYIESWGIRIDVDDIPELFEWTNEFIEKSETEFTELIINLFTGYISIETRSYSKFIQLFDSDGFFVDSISHNNLFHMITGRYIFRHKDFRRLYLPMFSKK